MALSDLLSGRSVDDMLESIPRLWELCFRVRDDIKVCESSVLICCFLLLSVFHLVHEWKDRCPIFRAMVVPRLDIES